MDHLALFHQGIGDFAHTFQRNPFDYLYERDLQAMLFAKCCHVFGDEEYRFAEDITLRVPIRTGMVLRPHL